MIVRHYMAWMRTAAAPARADATAALAHAYLRSEMDPSERGEAEAALTLALDDREAAVRIALAEALADCAEAPRHVILALAGDRSEVAAIVLQRSPLLSDAELIEMAVAGDVAAQVAVARRAFVAAPVAAALAEVADEPAALALLGNVEAEVPAFSLARIVERFGSNSAVRNAVLARPSTPVDVRFAVMLAERRALALADRDGALRREQFAHEDEERVAVALASLCDEDDLAGLVAHLRATGRLTAGVMLRALLSGDLRLPTSALANLAGMAERRAAALMVEPRAGGWRALYRKAGLPESLMPAFASAVQNCREVTADFAGLCGGPVVARRIIARVLADRDVQNAVGGERVLAVLRRFEVETARDEARLAASMMLDSLAIAHKPPLALAAPVPVSAQFEPPVSATIELAHEISKKSRADEIRPIVLAAIEDALLLRGSVVEADIAVDPAPVADHPPAALITPDKVLDPSAAEHRQADQPPQLLATDLAAEPQLFAEQDEPSDWADDMIPAAANDKDPVTPVFSLPSVVMCADTEAPVLTVEARALLRIEEMVAQAYADARRQERAA
ncbi:hypothetical protein GCM10007036_33020 [Alsobacter metallidurans]|uniref:DUF2336 domain-containing protein n=1 Tax=Alsobacter metallidurans TaxID=340221 RepID=A0A917IAG0_9HYPH|nr:DUF2336 domain-containing protein [Alsobacter metallidurans]GGH25724.1 hypothetical protein GCM10007036_33020 [Alsobacter metallidurans]